MDVTLTRRGQILEMLRVLYDAVPTDSGILKDMETRKVTHLLDVKPSSFKFVIKTVIIELGGVL